MAKRYFVFETDILRAYQGDDGLDEAAALALVAEMLANEEFDPEDVTIVVGEVAEFDVQRTVTLQK